MKFFDTKNQLNSKDIHSLELKYNLIFPKEYREHLLLFNGGYCEPNLICFIEDSCLTQTSVNRFFNISNLEVDNLGEMIEILKIDEIRIPKSFIPFANDPGGNIFCIDQTNGSVYFWNHEKEGYFKSYDDNNWPNCYFIATSFSEFISLLH